MISLIRQLFVGVIQLLLRVLGFLLIFGGGVGIVAGEAMKEVDLGLRDFLLNAQVKILCRLWMMDAPGHSYTGADHKNDEMRDEFHARSSRELEPWTARVI